MIEPLYVQSLVSEKSLFNLGTANTFAIESQSALGAVAQHVFEIFGDLDLIDIMNLNHTSYLRVRNYQGAAKIVNTGRQLSPTLMMQIVDEDLYLHCLERKKIQFP